jgi:predicted small lipoprotein YifL
VDRAEDEAMRRAFLLPLVVAFAAGLAGCGEKPPRTDPEGAASYNGVNQAHPMYERTQVQGESRRMSY